MRKIVLLLVVVALLMPMMFLNVYASSVPYQWRVGGEEVNVNKPNGAGTARLEKDGKTVTLYLNNYNGGKLELECYGTGQSDVVFIINLEGENTITADDTGISMGESKSSKVQFQGTGKLTINAQKPISYEEETNQKIIDLSKKEETTSQETTSEGKTEEVQDTTSNEEITTTGEKAETSKEENDNNANDWLVRVLGILLLVCIGVISFLD